jgi:cholera toxin transcriptional activator
VSAPPQPKRKSAVARFGVFEADLDARELRKNGRRLKLQDQPFAVLSMLLKCAGGVVTREDLREKLWPADTFVDFDHSLNTAVNKIREVLGDSASNPRFVETLARRGYRFLGDVSWESHQPPASREVESGRVPDIESSLPAPHRGIPRGLFGLIQFMYLVFYVEALLHWQAIDRIPWAEGMAPWTLIAVIVTAGVGIPVRFYLLSAVAFDYRKLGQKFERIFLAVLILDELWAIAPFLLLNQIGFGPAFGATAALLYVPFAERTLVRMAYR